MAEDTTVNEAFDAKLAKEEADRAQPEVEAEKVNDPELEKQVEAESKEEKEETTEETKEEPTVDDEMQKRISRLAYDARESKKLAKQLQEEIQRLKGELPPLPRDEQIISEAKALAKQEVYNRERYAEGNKIKEAGMKAYPDFADALRNFGAAELTISDAVVEAATEAAGDNAHKVFYYLGNNIDEAERIFNLSPVKQGAALAKLANQVSQIPVKQQSKAPPPIKTLNGRGRADVSDEKMSMKEYMEREDQKERDRRR